MSLDIDGAAKNAHIAMESLIRSGGAEYKPWEEYEEWKQDLFKCVVVYYIDNPDKTASEGHAHRNRGIDACFFSWEGLDVTGRMLEQRLRAEALRLVTNDQI